MLVFMQNGDAPQRIDTGVEGLNDILSGGLPSGHMYLLEGNPGTGKTTLAMQFVMTGVRAGKKALYVTLSESQNELAGSARSHGWDPAEIPIVELIPVETTLLPEEQYTVFNPSEVELAGTIHKLTQLIDEVKPDRVVIDSLSELRLLASDTMRYRRQLLALKHFFAGREMTVLMLDDRTAEGSDMQLQSIAHGVLRLEKLHRSYGVTRRHAEVIKLRGSSFREGLHDYTIERGGLRIYPRLIASEHDADFTGERLGSGLPVLDGMFGGGINRGSSTLILGPSGCGKSTIGMVYASAAAKRGHRAIMYVFDEVLRTAQSRAEGLGMPVRELIAKGDLAMSQIDPAELSPGEFASRIRRDVETNDTRVVVIDGLNGYLLSMPGERDLMLHLHELISYLSQNGVVTILIYAQPGIVGSMQTEVDVSYLSDTIILLRYFEVEGEIRRLVSVIKQRFGAHEPSLRELCMSEKGVEIGRVLKGYNGVLSGIPTVSESLS